MSLYYKNKNTGEVKLYNFNDINKLGAALRTDPWEQISENEVPVNLEKLKIEKVKQLENYIKLELCKPLTIGKEGYIECEPYNIFLTGFSMSDKGAEVKHRRLVDKNGKSLKKTITLKKSDFLSLSSHYEARKDNAYLLAAEIEIAIENAKTVEQLNKIKITEKMIGSITKSIIKKIIININKD